MPKSQSSSAPRPVAGQADPTPLRVITPRRPLVNRRAALGGVLVAVAAMGTFAVAINATQQPTSAVVTLTHDVPAGTVLSAADLRVTPMHLDDSMRSHVMRATQDAIGTTTLGPIGAGEILQPSSVAVVAGGLAGSSGPELSFSLPAERALGGALRSGETIDVLTTDKNSTETVARTVATVKILRVEKAGTTALGNSSNLLLTVVAADRNAAAAIAGAIDQGQVTLVRTTGLGNT